MTKYHYFAIVLSLVFNVTVYNKIYLPLWLKLKWLAKQHKYLIVWLPWWQWSESTRTDIITRVKENHLIIFIRGQVWCLGIVIACVCVSVHVCACVCVNPEFLHAITHHLVEPQNADKRCKTPYDTCFGGLIYLYLQGQIELKGKNIPHYELVHTILTTD